MNKKLLAALAVAGIAAAVANRDRVAQGLTWVRTKGEEGLAWVIAQVPLPFGLATDDPTPEGGELPERHAAAPHVDGLMRHVHGLIRRPSADALGPYRGQWVAVRGGAVALSGGSATELVRHLRSSQETADSLFFVPLDPKIDRHGEQ